MNTLYELRILALAIAVALSVAVGCNGQNPIIQTNFTADPAPMVYNGTVYLYTSHDEDDATGFHMLDWKLYTSTDMVNWTDHGTVASLATFPWAVQSNDAWAPQVIERNGKFYLYVPISVPGSPKNVIAVAVADSSFRSVQGCSRASTDRQSHREHRSHGFHRRRRPGIPLLGQPESLVREAERGHDFVFWRDCEGRFQTQRIIRKVRGSTSEMADTTWRTPRTAARKGSATP